MTSQGYTTIKVKMINKIGNPIMAQIIYPIFTSLSKFGVNVNG